MDKQNTTGSRGGARPGSGRTPKLKDPINKQIRLERTDVEQIEELGYNVSEFYREAGHKRLQRILSKKTK
jgi:hypothetical protein